MPQAIAVCAAFSLLMFVGPLAAQTEKPAGAKPEPVAKEEPKKTKSEGYAVIKINVPHESGYSMDVAQVVKNSDLEAKRKQIEDGNKQRSDEYEKAKQEALAAKKKFNTPPPKPQTMKVVNDTFKTEADARAAADKENKKSGTSPAPADKPKGK
jgi:hypothetical protein